MTTYQPGDQIGDYRIQALIARGGMAVVYRAEDTRLGRNVALKLLTPQLAASDQFRQRFIRESRLAASLDHPNIVPIYGAGEADGQLFIAMRYVVGSDLKGLLVEQGGQLPLDMTLRLFGQLGGALDAAHRAGLVHRDVKPGNILITSAEPSRRAHVYLTDFGLTKRTSESRGLTGSGQFLGTVDYIAPEQIQGRPVGASTDIYALGCVLYECLTGALPFRRDDHAGLLWAHLVASPPPVTGIRPELPAAVNAVVSRAMAKDPANRFVSCEHLLRELEVALGTHRPGDLPGGPPRARIGGARDRSAPPSGGGPVGYSLAVDVGTSYVAAAVADDHGLDMVALGDGAVVAPAAVYAAGDGRILAGAAAARRAMSHPERFAGEVKSRLGSSPVVLAGVPYAARDLLAVLLQDVLSRVTQRRGAEPAVVALTHPATGGPHRRELFRDVARAAGLVDAVHTAEPEAAATHHALTHPLEEGEVLAVYDLGGGTFDATVLRRTAQGFELVGTPEGIERVSGSAFDQAVLAHVNHHSGGALAAADPTDPSAVVGLTRLRQDCALAREALSVDIETLIPVLLPNRHVEVTLTRTQLEAMVRAPIASTIRTVDRVLRAARVDRTDLTAVLLVGGCSRTPLIAQMVAEAFGRPTYVGPHPKHGVALGAALLAEARRRSQRDRGRR